MTQVIGMMLQALIVLAVLSYYVAKFARQQGYSGFLWFLLSFLGSWVASFILLCALPDRIQRGRRVEQRRYFSEMVRGSRGEHPPQAMAVDFDTIGNLETIVHDVQ